MLEVRAKARHHSGGFPRLSSSFFFFSNTCAGLVGRRLFDTQNKLLGTQQRRPFAEGHPGSARRVGKLKIKRVCRRRNSANRASHHNIRPQVDTVGHITHCVICDVIVHHRTLADHRVLAPLSRRQAELDGTVVRRHVSGHHIRQCDDSTLFGREVSHAHAEHVRLVVAGGVFEEEGAAPARDAVLVGVPGSLLLAHLGGHNLVAADGRPEACHGGAAVEDELVCRLDGVCFFVLKTLPNGHLGAVVD